MMLREYLDLNKLSYTAFARMIDAAPLTVRKYCKFEFSPCLFVALKISRATNGLVSFEEMLPRHKQLKLARFNPVQTQVEYEKRLVQAVKDEVTSERELLLG